MDREQTDVTSAPEAVASASRGAWPIFLTGVLLCLVAPAAYVIQIRLKHLGTPWYLPIVSSAGVVLMILSLLRRRGIVRGAILIPLALLCGFEWFAVAVATRTPAYRGPAQPGRPVPPFRSTLADGTPFSAADLANGTSTAMVFYRGRW
ncbi:MAG: hypothetical protein U0790_12030 [Isosphaeraceae bacterium]